MNERGILARAGKMLATGGIEGSARDARKLYEYAYQTGALTPEPQTRDTPNQTTSDTFKTALAERLKHSPVSQIIGKRSFWKHDFIVTPDVLDPRPETELLVELALQGPFDRVLDLGTGSGCILISLLAERPTARGVGTDISEAAVLVAGENAAAIGVADRLILPLSEWFDDIGGRYDLIVSNPPYIALDEMPDLAPEVRDHEPRMALTDEGDGLDAYRAIAAKLCCHLSPGGRVLVEIGPTQGRAVSAMLGAAGLKNIAIHPDLDGRDRVVSALSPQ